MRQRQGRARLERLDRDAAANLPNERQVEQLVDEEVLIVLELWHDDFEEIVDLARHEMAGNHLRHGHHSLLECERLIVGVAVDLDAEKGREAETDAAPPQG